MKKIALLSLLMFISYSMSAQWYITPEVGLSAVNSTETYESSWRPVFKIGVGMEYKFTERFSLKSGLYYAKRSSSFESVYFDSHENSYSQISSSINRNFLQIPILANWSWNVGDDVRLNIGIGPYVAMVPLGSQTYGWSGTSYPFDSYGYGNYAYYPDYGYGGYYDSFHNNASSFDWGATLAVGLEVKQWVINATYDAALGKEYRYDDISNKYNTLSLSVGYKFKLGK